jgi:hypothetical protein
MEPREAVVALVSPRHSRVAVQARAIAEWTRSTGRTVLRTVEATPEEIGEACEDVRVGDAAGVVAVRLDVLGDVTDQEAVRSTVTRLGGRLHVVDPADAQQDEHPSGVREMLRAYDDRVTGLGKQAARARLHRGAAVKRAVDGRSGGRSPYGWRFVAGQLVEDAAEQAARARIRVLRADGHGYAEIGRQLGVEGYRRRDGGEGTWHPDTVRRIVLRMEEEDRRQEGKPVPM